MKEKIERDRFKTTSIPV